MSENKEKAQWLLNKKAGSFLRHHGREAGEVLDFFRTRRATDVESVNLSIALLQRLVTECATTNIGVHQTKWLRDHRKVNLLLNNWKQAAANQGRDVDVVSPEDLLDKLRYMSTTLPKFRFINIVTIGKILDVMIKQAHPRMAPFVAQDLLESARTMADELDKPELLPNTFVHNIVLQTWAVSGLPQAPHRMDGILEKMRSEGFAPDPMTYNILVQFWTSLGIVNRVEGLLLSMKEERVCPTRQCLAAAISCFLKKGYISTAKEYLTEMRDVPVKDKRENGLIAESTQNILLAYGRVLEDSNLDGKEKEKVVKHAKTLYKRIVSGSDVSDEEKSKYSGAVPCMPKNTLRDF